MEVLIANVEDFKLDIEMQLDEQIGAQMLPFPGMDKATASVCTFYSRGICRKSNNCPFRHVRGDQSVVCKHWLRGLCKKGDQCEFLHEYDMTKMPECYFFSRFNACHNKECPFLHINPNDKMKDCPWYDRGFCRHGPSCRNRHVRRVLCTNYLAGFCPQGLQCKFMHPRFELPQIIDDGKPKQKKSDIVCHTCGEPGHKSNQCGGRNNTLVNFTSATDSPKGPMLRFGGNKFDHVTCYKCGEKGHFANVCPNKVGFSFPKSFPAGAINR